MSTTTLTAVGAALLLGAGAGAAGTLVVSRARARRGDGGAQPAREEELRRELRRVRTRLRRIRRRGRQSPPPPPSLPGSPAGATAAAEDPLRAACATLAGLGFDGARPSVVVVLQQFEPALVFAGVRTAVGTAARLATALDRPLRVLVLGRSTAAYDEARAALVAQVRTDYPELAESLLLSTAGHRNADRHHHPDDVWVATLWTTAYALAREVREGRVRRDRVVYLIQDFEAAFYPWGQRYAQALSTYDAGFTPLVNSRSLARFVTDQTGMRVPSEAVFASDLDLPPLLRAAERWRPADGPLRVLFYARPSKPRNMYQAGVEALRRWGSTLPEDVEAVVRFAGEELGGRRIDLTPALRAEALGKLSYEQYYDLLAETDLGLALMLSPHPGHLSLELPMAGIPTVTNGFGSYREPWVSGLLVAGTGPDSVADTLGRAAQLARGLSGHAPGRVQADLGGSVAEAVSAVAELVRSAG